MTVARKARRQMSAITAKVIVLMVLYLFLPLTAVTYYAVRRRRRTYEVERIFAILHIDPAYRLAYDDEDAGRYYLWAVGYASVVVSLGLMLLFLGPELGVGEFPRVPFGPTTGTATDVLGFPQRGSRLVVGMAFLGAYLYGLQYVLRRYLLNDLRPSVYYGLSLRLILAAGTALVLYNAYAAVASVGTAGGVSGGTMTLHIWPTLAFLIGTFPQRGLRWLTDRLPMLAPETEAVRRAPLDLIEGIESHDSLRLEEVGIDTCYDLATADFVPLMLKTPYSARQLIDWMLQAKLCVYFGDAVQNLRGQGFRTVLDLAQLTPKEIDVLAAETALTKSALAHAQQSVQHEAAELERLREVGQLLGTFWDTRTAPPHPGNGHHDEAGPPPVEGARSPS
jgi:hypothetical protein